VTVFESETTHDWNQPKLLRVIYLELSEYIDLAMAALHYGYRETTA
jgi:hypothetical protein